MFDPGRPKAADIKWKWTEVWEVYMFATFKHVVFVLEYLFFNLFLVHSNVGLRQTASGISVVPLFK